VRIHHLTPARAKPVRSLVLVALSAVALLAAGCTSAAHRSGPPARPKDAIKGGTVTLANAAGYGASWILPLPQAEYFANAAFLALMYRPLYLFGGNSNSSVSVNYPLSLASAPVYGDHGRTVTINLKGWRWSDGETVSARDVIFWLNLAQAEKRNFVSYLPGTLPDNLVSYRATGADQVTLHLSRSYSALWSTYNQLAEITPLPLAWDVSSPGAAPGSGGCLADTAADHWARCAAVYRYLVSQAKDFSSYASPGSVWAISDGPWKLRSFSIDGSYAFVPNKKYSGSPKPALAELRFKAFLTDSAIESALRAGALSVATVPAGDLPAKPASQQLPSANPLAAAGYQLQPAYAFAIGFAYENWNNPVYGPVFRQLYFRQALQELTDQAAIVQTAYGGYGYPTTAGVPDRPDNPWVSAGMRANNGNGPYPFDPARAQAALAAHGWRKIRGVLTCENAGSGTGQCGAGVARGLRATFILLGSSGIAAQQLTMDRLRSELGSAGIRLKRDFPQTLISPAPCHGPSCTWALEYFGGWAFNGPGFEPSGEQLFQSGVATNIGGYADPRMDMLIRQAQASISAFHAYASYTATQLPVLFLPWGYSVVAVSDKLHEVTQSPLGTFLPEYWYLTR
jgi:peptide/nickel transport system substrate-binding protein